MENQSYLLLIYWLILGATLILSGISYACLRNPTTRFVEENDTLRTPHLLKFLISNGLLMFSLMTFLSFSYQGCDDSNFGEWISDLENIKNLNAKHIQEILRAMTWVMGFFGLLCVFMLRARLNQQKRDREH